MLKNRCFLCGHKMAENGLCSNADCVRSTPVPGTVVAEALAEKKETEKPENTDE